MRFASVLLALLVGACDRPVSSPDSSASSSVPSGMALPSASRAIQDGPPKTPPIELSISVVPSAQKSMGGPSRIRIVPDQYHTECVGVTSDGFKFFVTGPFIPAIDDNPGCEFAAAFLWNRDGSFREARIINLGPRAELQDETQTAAFVRLREALGPFEREAIDVAPFEFEHAGTTFGLVYTEFEGSEWVELLPGNYVAFTPPWKGGYDT